MSDPTASQPWNGNPNITRKEAADAKREGRELPVPPALAEAAAAMVLAKVPKQEIAERLGYDGREAGKLMKSPEVNNALRVKMAEAGIDETLLSQKMREGLDAMVVVTAKDKGIITDEKAFPDYKTRREYLETVLDVRDELPSKRRGRDGGGDNGPRLKITVDAKYAQVFFGDCERQPVVEIQSGAELREHPALPEADHRD